MAHAHVIVGLDRRGARVVGCDPTGPSQTKWAFERCLEQRRADIARHVVGVETVDRPRDRELAAFGRHRFTRIDALGLEPGAPGGLAT